MCLLHPMSSHTTEKCTNLVRLESVGKQGVANRLVSMKCVAALLHTSHCDKGCISMASIISWMQTMCSDVIDRL